MNIINQINKYKVGENNLKLNQVKNKNLVPMAKNKLKKLFKPIQQRNKCKKLVRKSNNLSNNI